MARRWERATAGSRNGTYGSVAAFGAGQVALRPRRARRTGKRRVPFGPRPTVVRPPGPPRASAPPRTPRRRRDPRSGHAIVPSPRSSGASSRGRRFRPSPRHLQPHAPGPWAQQRRHRAPRNLGPGVVGAHQKGRRRGKQTRDERPDARALGQKERNGEARFAAVARHGDDRPGERDEVGAADQALVVRLRFGGGEHPPYRRGPVGDAHQGHAHGQQGPPAPGASPVPRRRRRAGPGIRE